METTRASLLRRVRNPRDEDSWREFFHIYQPLLYRYARARGLDPEKAEEVAQQCLALLTEKMPTFEYDPEKCSFKGWLKHVTRLRIVDQYRRRQPGHRPLKPPGQDTRSTATIERIEDPHGVELEKIWDDEWEQNLVDVAMERVKRQVNAEHYQMFYMSAVQGISPREVAKMLGKNVGHVYLVRHRVAKLVKKEKDRLESKRYENGL